MNFLSHFYFERKKNNPERTLGSILPDLLRNMDREIRIFPEKHAEIYVKDAKLLNIFRGWRRHIETDRVFHNNVFFIDKTRQLKAHLTPVVIDTPIRTSFLSHIALELLLDRLLLKDSWLHENDFYEQLGDVDEKKLVEFLNLSGVEDASSFVFFFKSFIADKYLGTYRNMEQVSYALDQVCKKFWKKGLGQEKKKLLTEALTEYEVELDHNYKSIFNEIAEHLNKNFE
ncbi:hypothetical protein H8S90_22330 [Olivibacter sp. SDN3]|uniref:hypothetical protein n=1 Tax=Olivibacter sp. SDN3 TaxID=2764720 RepID=UPI00165172D6|nr:hypothetical protein [Olivibacter sp. SDN3]QNL49433.1 hypothetical protein H8S90_22330 [Olivibacter sp. SDN3]